MVSSPILECGSGHTTEQTRSKFLPLPGGHVRTLCEARTVLTAVEQLNLKALTICTVHQALETISLGGSMVTCSSSASCVLVYTQRSLRYPPSGYSAKLDHPLASELSVAKPCHSRCPPNTIMDIPSYATENFQRLPGPSPKLILSCISIDTLSTFATLCVCPTLLNDDVRRHRGDILFLIP